MKNYKIVNQYILVLLLFTTSGWIFSLSESIEQKKVTKQTIKFYKIKLNECDSTYNENVKILDSVLKSNDTHTKRVLNLLHSEKRYRNGNKRF